MKLILYFVVPALFLLGIIVIGFAMYRATEAHQVSIEVVDTIPTR